jgi:hypothetical protein
MAIDLVEFDMDKGNNFLKSGEPVTPVWLDWIPQQLEVKLEKQSVKIAVLP